MEHSESISSRMLFLRHVAQTSPAPLGLQIVSAEGCYLYDASGKKYLDLIAGIGPSVLGHRYPRIQQAVEHQLNQYWHTLVYGEFILQPQVRLATLLAAQTAQLDSLYFVNSGAEATEGAMKLAKRYTGRYEIIACRNAYHGSTQGAASLMSPDYFTRSYQPLLPGIGHIHFNDLSDLERITERTAAVVAEVVQGEAGVFPADRAWLRALRQRCTEVGALLVLDEIQSGYGRTGALFAFQSYDIEPDVLLLAKGFGGGMPIGAFLANRAVMQSLSHDPVLGHITTFGGHPVCAAAALATLEALLEENWISEAAQKAALFRQMLAGADIQALRGAGLWFALDLGDAARVQRAIAYCLEQGLIVDWFLFNDRSIRIAPPLTISEAELAWAAGVLRKGVG